MPTRKNTISIAGNGYLLIKKMKISDMGIFGISKFSHKKRENRSQEF